jgi:3-mercaptopyruvate sulfurtransferase SseA
VALLLRKKGVKRIRPLQGGLEEWRRQGFPLANATEEGVAANSMSASERKIL